MSSSVDWLAVAKQALTTVWARSPLLNACVPVRKQDAVASSIEVHSIPIGFDEHSSDVDPVDQARYNLSQVARAAEDTVAEVLRTGLTQRVRVVGPHDDVLVRLHRGWGGGHTPPLVFIGLRAPKKSSLADLTWRTGLAHGFVSGASSFCLRPGVCGLFAGSPPVGPPDGMQGTNCEIVDPTSFDHHAPYSALYFRAVSSPPSIFGPAFERGASHVVSIQHGAVVADQSLGCILEVD